MKEFRLCKFQQGRAGRIVETEGTQNFITKKQKQGGDRLFFATFNKSKLHYIKKNQVELQCMLTPLKDCKRYKLQRYFFFHLENSVASSYKCFGDEQGKYPLQCPGVLQTCDQRSALLPLTLKLISANQWPLRASAAYTVLVSVFASESHTALGSLESWRRRD